MAKTLAATFKLVGTLLTALTLNYLKLRQIYILLKICYIVY